jgi:hypothetical protein
MRPLIKHIFCKTNPDIKIVISLTKKSDKHHCLFGPSFYILKEVNKGVAGGKS